MRASSESVQRPLLVQRQETSGSINVDYGSGLGPGLSVPTREGGYKVEASRWWVLAWFSYIAALQSLLWFTYSSVPDHSKQFLGVTDQALNMFLNEGPIAFCCTVWYANWLLTRPSGTGLRNSVITAAVLCFLGATIRCIPLLYPTVFAHNVALGLIHVAQTLNAAAAPFVVASVSALSLEWFSESERNTATAIGNVASAAGRAVGFFFGTGDCASTESTAHTVAGGGCSRHSAVDGRVDLLPHPSLDPPVAGCR
eukprot:m.204477 g.204477  ORF g.204477 m.204477 type:complete len:255 (-) comp22532_c0_seq1:825-1589(-)